MNYSKIFNLLKEKIGLISIITFVLVLFGVLYFFFIDSTLNSLENYTYDIRCRIDQKFNDNKKPPISACLLYSNQCSKFISDHPELELGKWPFPRAFWADINNYLIRSNSQTVLFDIIFTGNSDDYNDDAFQNSLKRSGTNYLAIIGFPFKSIIKNIPTLNNKNINLNDLTINRIDSLISVIQRYQNIKTSSSSKLSIFKENSKQININEQTVPAELLVNLSYMDFNLPFYKFTEYAKGLGLVNINTTDNIIRTSILIARFEKNNILPSLALSGVLDVLPPNDSQLALNDNDLILGNKKISLNERGEYHINWDSFEYNKYTPVIKAYLYEKYYSLDPSNGLRILPEEENYFKKSVYSNYYSKNTYLIDYNLLYLENYRIKFLNANILEQGNGSTSLNTAKTLENYTNLFNSTSTILRKNYSQTSENIEKYGNFVTKPEKFTGNIVIIGDGEATSDIYNTPLNKPLSGPSIISNIINNLLNDNIFIHKSSLLTNFLIYMIFISLCLCILKFSKNNVGSLFLFILLILIYLLLCSSAFVMYKLWLPIVKPSFIFTLFFMFAIISQNLLTREQLHKTYKLATTDGLTGLYNHRYFQEKMVTKIQEVKRKEDSFSILLIDIDFFKKFNDTYGHRAGDAVLIQVGKALNNSVRNNDIVCRYGGEEMCVILDKTFTDEAVLIANKLVQTIASTDFLIEDETKVVSVHISVGVANYPSHGATVPQLVEFADQGLYRAKEGGRNRVGELEDTFNSQGVEVVSKELEIAKAKAIKEIEKIKAICIEKNINFDDVANEILGKKEES